MFKTYLSIFILSFVVFKSFSQLNSTGEEWLNQFHEVSMKIEEDIETDPYGPPIYLVPVTDTVSAMDTIRYDVFFGTDEKEAEGVYGLTMKWRHETSEIYGGNNSASFDGVVWTLLKKDCFMYQMTGRKAPPLLSPSCRKV